MGISLQDIEDLSAEVSSLVQAGLPLESHLAEAGRGQSRRLEQLTSSISDDLSNGNSLDSIIRSNKLGAPRILTACVAAGIRTGNLAAAIEVLGDMAHDIVELRRRILQSISYPLTVLGLALVLFSVYIRGFLARVRTVVFDDVDAKEQTLLEIVLRWDENFWWWPWLIPGSCVVGLIVWLSTGRAASMSFRGPERLLLALPGVGSMVRDLQFYNLSRMTCLLVEREIPLSESIRLAGACCGNSKLDEACQRTAVQLESGTSPAFDGGAWKPGKLPPLFASCLQQTSDAENVFNERLSGVAGYYRRRVQSSLGWLRSIVPVAMFIIIGGGSVALYGLTVFWPVMEIYRLLAPN